MHITRRTFLEALGAGTAAAGALQLPFAGGARAATPPVSAGGSAAPPILLNSNENAYGPSARVSAAIRDAVGAANRYPDTARREFIERVAARHRVSEKQVLVGCGSVEILRVAAQAFTGPGKKLIMASPTFEVIGHFGEAVGAEVVKVRLTSDFAHDLSAMQTAIGGGAGLIYICNPNNPTASLTPRKELDAFIGKLPAQAHVLIDEAYHHFVTASADYVSFLDRAASSDRVFVARTFSKAYGLAGLRLGYAVGPAPEIERMLKLMSPENSNVSALRAAIAGLADEEGIRAAVDRNAADRAEFMRQAGQRKLSPIPSHANFAMMNVGRPVNGVIDDFKKRGILVGRPFPPFDSYLRVSFGRPAEMTEFWRVWDELPRRT